MTGRSRLLGGSLVVALALPIGCSDDGHLLGERSSSGGSGGSSAQAGASTSGSSGANSGGTNTGGTNTGGTNTGGTAGSAAAGDGGSAGANGATGSGGSASGTGGNAGAPGGASGTANGGDGGAATGGAGDGGSGMGKPCADQTCAASEACVASRTVGGAITFPGDGGMCPGGSHVENQYCLANFAYRCVAQPGCPAGGDQLLLRNLPSAVQLVPRAGGIQWLDTDAELVCEQLAP